MYELFLKTSRRGSCRAGRRRQPQRSRSPASPAGRPSCLRAQHAPASHNPHTGDEEGWRRTHDDGAVVELYQVNIAVVAIVRLLHHPHRLRRQAQVAANPTAPIQSKNSGPRDVVAGEGAVSPGLTQEGSARRERTRCGRRPASQSPARGSLPASAPCTWTHPSAGGPCCGRCGPSTPAHVGRDRSGDGPCGSGNTSQQSDQQHMAAEQGQQGMLRTWPPRREVSLCVSEVMM